MRRPTACGSRCARTPRRRWAVSSSSKRIYRRRSHRCGRAATTLRAICFSSASAHPAMRSARSRSWRRRSAGLWLHYAAFIDGIRETIDKRIRAVIPGDEGSIASALITGKRDAISTPVNDAMYISSLAHVLSISGYHMAVVAGIVFFFIRAGLALIPSIASRHPIKKWAAAAALVAATFYLLLSGAEVATQRSFIMIAIVLAGVMVDRPALTF